jgi:hypothetical protein
MSLAGFKASNHPQQTGKRGAVDAVDDRAVTALRIVPDPPPAASTNGVPSPP